VKVFTLSTGAKTSIGLFKGTRVWTRC